MRWRIRITDTQTQREILDADVGRIQASAVATVVGMEEVSRRIIGDPRSDDVKPPVPPSPSSIDRDKTPDR